MIGLAFGRWPLARFGQGLGGSPQYGHSTLSADMQGPLEARFGVYRPCWPVRLLLTPSTLSAGHFFRDRPSASSEEITDFLPSLSERRISYLALANVLKSTSDRVSQELDIDHPFGAQVLSVVEWRVLVEILALGSLTKLVVAVIPPAFIVLTCTRRSRDTSSGSVTLCCCRVLIAARASGSAVPGETRKKGADFSEITWAKKGCPQRGGGLLSGPSPSVRRVALPREDLY